MKLKIFAIGAVALLMAGWAVAEDNPLSGTWTAKTVSARGSAEQTITFKQSGDSFTGVMITSQGDMEPIKDGKIKGDELEFNVERKQPSGETSKVAYKGKLNRDQITGTFVGATGRSVDWTAARK
jgi:hypothetical protein